MPANRFGIDLGEVYRTGAAVKGARTANKLAELNLGEKQREVAGRPERERLAKERNVMLTGLRTQTAAGESGAAQQLLAVDPEGGAKFIEAVGQMDDRKRAATKRSVEEIGQLSAYVLQGKTPEEQARRYAMMRKNMNPQAVANLPEQYDPGFMELSLTRATAMDKLLEAPTVRGVGGEDVVYRGGREIERKTRPVKAGAGSGGLKSADESFMLRSAVNILGGMYDREGNISMLSKIARNDAQAIATRASELFAKGGTTRARAVTKAAQELGIPVPNIGEQQGQLDPEDPLGIR